MFDFPTIFELPKQLLIGTEDFKPFYEWSNVVTLTLPWYSMQGQYFLIGGRPPGQERRSIDLFEVRGKVVEQTLTPPYDWQRMRYRATLVPAVHESFSKALLNKPIVLWMNRSCIYLDDFFKEQGIRNGIGEPRKNEAAVPFCEGYLELRGTRFRIDVRGYNEHFRWMRQKEMEEMWSI